MRLLILEQLTGGEKQVLSLVVAVRRVIDQSDTFKGDLSASVKSALRALVASREIVNTDGVYSIARRPAGRVAAASSSER